MEIFYLENCEFSSVENWKLADFLGEFFLQVIAWMQFQSTKRGEKTIDAFYWLDLSSNFDFLPRHLTRRSKTTTPPYLKLFKVKGVGKS